MVFRAGVAQGTTAFWTILEGGGKHFATKETNLFARKKGRADDTISFVVTRGIFMNRGLFHAHQIHHGLALIYRGNVDPFHAMRTPTGFARVFLFNAKVMAISTKDMDSHFNFLSCRRNVIKEMPASLSPSLLSLFFCTCNKSSSFTCKFLRYFHLHEKEA